MFSALAASAADLPPGKWWRRPEVVQRLVLTEEQQVRLDAIFRGAANGLIDSKAEIDKIMVAIRGELDQPQLNRGNLQKLAADLSDARGRLFERELMMLIDMRGALTEQQWSTLKDHLERMRNQRRK
jgi:hypothetical protein